MAAEQPSSTSASAPDTEPDSVQPPTPRTSLTLKDWEKLLKVPCAETEQDLRNLEQKVEELFLLVVHLVMDLIGSNRSGRPMSTVTYKMLSKLHGDIGSVRSFLRHTNYGPAIMFIVEELPHAADIKRRLNRRLVSESDKQKIVRCLGAVYKATQRLYRVLPADLQLPSKSQ